MKIDKKNILLHLYGEAPEGSKLQTLLKDDELRGEYRVLSEAKFRMDHKKRERPDREVIDRVLAAAATGEPFAAKTLRPDRGAIFRNTRLRKLLIPAMTIAAVVVLGIGIGWFGDSSDQVVPATARTFVDDSLVPPESLFRYVPSRQGLVTQVGVVDPRLAWDDGLAMPDLYRRMEMLRPISDLDWGESSIPLEMLPASSQKGLMTTSANR